MQGLGAFCQWCHVHRQVIFSCPQWAGIGQRQKGKRNPDFTPAPSSAVTAQTRPVSPRYRGNVSLQVPCPWRDGFLPSRRAEQSLFRHLIHFPHIHTPSSILPGHLLCSIAPRHPLRQLCCCWRWGVTPRICWSSIGWSRVSKWPLAENIHLQAISRIFMWVRRGFGKSRQVSKLW